MAYLTPFISFTLSFILLTFPFIFPKGGVSYVGLTQIVGKIRTDVFGNALYGVHGDSIAIEGILKDYLPENMRMCDVTYPR